MRARTSSIRAWTMDVRLGSAVSASSHAQIPPNSWDWVGEVSTCYKNEDRTDTARLAFFPKKHGWEMSLESLQGKVLNKVTVFFEPSISSQALTIRQYLKSDCPLLNRHVVSL